MGLAVARRLGSRVPQAWLAENTRAGGISGKRSLAIEGSLDEGEALNTCATAALRCHFNHHGESSRPSLSSIV